MVIVIGMFVLIAAIIAGAAALLSTGGDAHALTGDVTLFGYHVTDTAGVMVIWGIAVGVIGLVELSLLLADTRRTHLARQIPGRSGNQSTPQATDEAKGLLQH
ncbi:hypothetical protein OG874_16050 [Nocardia sp. NBC_00565]|uniref:hypothetical protein n=1 Tax=Nocardia sp. NBC_00565 TaxID=2975993 RepID=UPI002E811AAB|nr:hypothetical protein [Nocardia sp. NBC_00565]WUC06543.1 hypothetical protein OG874_16050 [Nocardia sp. NBC_00565]